MGLLGAEAFLSPFCFFGFPGGSDSKASARNVGVPGSIPRSGRSPGERNGNPAQYSCLENPMDRGDWQTIVYGVTRVWYDLATKPPQPYSSWVTKSRTRLSKFHFTINIAFGKVSVIVLILILEFVVTLPFWKHIYRLSSFKISLIFTHYQCHLIYPASLSNFNYSLIYLYLCWFMGRH